MLRSTSTPVRRAVAAVLASGLLLTACSDDTPAPTVNDDQLAASPEPVAEASASPDAEPVEEPSTEPETPASEDATPITDDASPVPTFDEVCAGREDEAFIAVLTPADGAVVEDGFTVTGCGNTFEATYLYRVVLDDGTVAAEGFGTMSCGSGCVGAFEQEITVGAPGEVTLVLFESSAEDGSEQNVVELALTVT